jgi:hypothetical protein
VKFKTCGRNELIRQALAKIKIMSNDHGKFVTAVNCMDGRVQDAVNQWLKNKYQADYVDVITEPGPDGILSRNADQAVTANIKKRLDISLSKHGSKVIALVAHDDCAGNPVSREEHKKDLLAGRETLKKMSLDAEIILLYVRNDWQTVEEIF